MLQGTGRGLRNEMTKRNSGRMELEDRKGGNGKLEEWNIGMVERGNAKMGKKNVAGYA